ncbi:MAG: hypothetical protein WCF76_07565, partial [Pseudolabrys sp.]
RAWWRSQATRSPCRPASGAVGSLPPPNPTFQPATGRRRRPGTWGEPPPMPDAVTLARLEGDLMGKVLALASAARRK